MWNIFKRYDPLDENIRNSFQENFQWLSQEFPNNKCKNIFTPTGDCFPTKGLTYDQRIFLCKEIICEAMEIPIDKVEIIRTDFFINKINTGNADFYLESDSSETKFQVGSYKYDRKKSIYEITIDDSCKDDLSLLISTLAHECCHIKLLGEKRIEKNDEYLTDLCTVFFGFGIFTANNSFVYKNNGDHWRINKYGYLNSKEWAYCLGLFAKMRNEQSPVWSKYLSDNIRSEFLKALKYIYDNNIG